MTPSELDRRPPGLPIRIAAMIYEALLLFGVSFIVSYALLAALRWTYPLAAYQRWTLQAVLFVAFGVYFVYCWRRSGQTLAMKSWHLRVVGPDGRPPSTARAVARYLLAWTLLVPGLALFALLHAYAGWDVAGFAVGLAAMLLIGRLGPARQFLHDRLLGTRVIRDRAS
jgi:uncharacterized RDD family membrane protein YckC